MAEKKISKLEKTALDGAFKDQFGSEWFIKIKPAYGTNGKGIDKVIFSFVKKGSSGKEYFDIFQDIDCFDNWADDILSGTMRDVLEAEAKAGEKYPKEYKYITGKDGEKSVGFMLSRTGSPLINASIKEQGKKAVYANVPLTYGWLKTVAKQFKRTSAPRFAELDKVMMEAANKYHHELTEDDESIDAIPSGETSAVKEEVEKPTVDKFKGNIYWCKDKGCEMQTRNNVCIIKAIVPKISDSETEGILQSDPNWQVVEAIFYPKNIERAKFTDKFNEICNNVQKNTKYKLPELNFSVGDVRDGYRQIIFQSA